MYLLIYLTSVKLEKRTINIKKFIFYFVIALSTKVIRHTLGTTFLIWDLHNSHNEHLLVFSFGVG